MADFIQRELERGTEVLGVLQAALGAAIAEILAAEPIIHVFPAIAAVAAL